MLAIRQLIAQNDAKRVALQLQRYGVTHLKGTGEISGCDGDGITTVVVRDGTTTASELLARKVVLSTGSKARRLKGIPFEQAGFYDSDSIGALRSKPSSLFVQGTGIIALEYATIFAEMGVQVSVAARGSREDLLPMLDGAMRDALLSDLEAKGVEILYLPASNPGRLILRGPVVELELPTGISERRFLSGALGGRAGAHHADLGMEFCWRLRMCPSSKPCAAGEPAVGNHGWIGLCDWRCLRQWPGPQSGDASPGLGGSRVAFAGTQKQTARSKQSVPCQPFDHLPGRIPELAFVGSSQSEAINSYGEAEVFSVLAPFADTIRGRLKALPASYFLKLVCLRQDGRILGVHVYGEGASELIHLGASWSPTATPSLTCNTNHSRLSPCMRCIATPRCWRSIRSQAWRRKPGSCGERTGSTGSRHRQQLLKAGLARANCRHWARQPAAPAWAESHRAQPVCLSDEAEIHPALFIDQKSMPIKS